MAVRREHAVLVRDQDDDVTAASTARRDLDVVRAALLGEPDAPIADVPAERLPVVEPDARLQDVATVLVHRGATHVLVAEEPSAVPAGMLSTFDLVAVLAGLDPRLARMVRQGPAARATTTDGSTALRSAKSCTPGSSNVPRRRITSLAGLRHVTGPPCGPPATWRGPAGRGVGGRLRGVRGPPDVRARCHAHRGRGPRGAGDGHAVGARRRGGLREPLGRGRAPHLVLRAVRPAVVPGWRRP
jgi:hypothetical protein